MTELNDPGHADLACSMFLVMLIFSGHSDGTFSFLQEASSRGMPSHASEVGFVTRRQLPTDSKEEPGGTGDTGTLSATVNQNKESHKMILGKSFHKEEGVKGQQVQQKDDQRNEDEDGEKTKREHFLGEHDDSDGD